MVERRDELDGVHEAERCIRDQFSSLDRTRVLEKPVGGSIIGKCLHRRVRVPNRGT